MPSSKRTLDPASARRAEVVDDGLQVLALCDAVLGTITVGLSAFATVAALTLPAEVMVVGQGVCSAPAASAGVA